MSQENLYQYICSEQRLSQIAHSDLSFDFGIIYMQWRHRIAKSLISLFDVQQADLSFVFLHIFADSFPLDTSQILTRLTSWKKVGPLTR